MPIKPKTDISLKLKYLKRTEEENRVKKMAERLGIPYANLFIIPISTEDITTITEEESERAEMVIVAKSGRKLKIAVKNPNNPVTKKMIESLESKGFSHSLLLVSQSSLEKARERYKLASRDAVPIRGVLRIEEKNIKQYEKEIATLKELKQRIAEIPTSELLSIIITGATKTKASDIHIEPSKQSIRLRYRIDGVLQDVTEFDKRVYHYLLSRIKTLSDLVLNVTDASQDGRFSIQITNKGKITSSMDVRVSVLPGGYGETIVMRLLSMTIADLKVEYLGMHDFTFKTLEREIKKPNGMIITTGPTGSGKTTTLYTFLNYVNKKGVKIITIEDPIEYKLAGITQTQVSKRKGFTFSDSLRSVVRQDPDILMIGEIRDKETAQIALHASLTGHLVFSTLHTNDAAGAIPRLYDMGIDVNLLPSALNAVIGQRLIRKLCPKCKKKIKPDKNTIEVIKKALSLISPLAKVDVPIDIPYIYEPQGCYSCYGLGYAGRTGIYEVLIVNDVIEKLILKKASTYDIRKKAMNEGMVTMLQDGLLKVVEGITSLEEIQRVAGDVQYLEELYGKFITSLLSRGIVITDKILKKLGRAFQPEKIKQTLLKSKIEDVTELIMAGAIMSGASDIHIEPLSKSFKIRYRIDGVMEEVGEMHKELFPPLLSQIKLLSGLKTDVHSVQEGRFNILYNNESIDTRLSIIPGGYGENVVIRILKQKEELLDLAKLGIREQYIKPLQREITRPTGLVLVTGPTSSGKTTTLYAIMHILNQKGTKIITVEDPVEYKMEGIIQTQVDEEAKYTFANAIKYLLRQNPNILMVGEVRDEETARIALQASATGHILSSTLHTNDAPSAIHRIINLGIEPKEVASSLNVIIAQRLVRKLVKKCAEKYKPNPKELSIIKKELSTVPEQFKLKTKDKDIILYKAKKCAETKTGYKGQIGIFEVMIANDELRKAIAENKSTAEIRKVAIKNGMITMRQDGILKSLEGVTTLEEVEKATGSIVYF